jgi:O-antigen ligase
LIANLKFFFPFLLPLLLVFSRSLADITIVLVSILFLFYSYKNKRWEWMKDKWFIFALVFTFYCLTFNSIMSIKPSESFLYAIFFVRWPIFAMALAYWILNDSRLVKNFLISMAVIIVFIIFDTWWQFIFDRDIFGFEKFAEFRLTGPFEGNPQVGVWTSKLILLLPLFLISYDKFKLQAKQNYIVYLFFISSTLLVLSVFISGERMALLMSLASIFILFIGLLADELVSFKKGIAISLLSFSLILIFAYSFNDHANRVFFSILEKILNWRTSDYGIVWRSAYDVWMQSPFFGAGLHKYREACENLGTYGATYLRPVSAGVCFHPHNISLQLLSETGIIGFVLFYLMVIFLAISSLKIYLIKKNWLNFAIVLSIIFTCFLPIQSGTSFFANKYGAIIWLLIGVMLATNKLFTKGK